MGRKPEQDRQRARVRIAEFAAVASIVLALIATGTALASRTAPKPKAATNAACVDSFDESCGPLHWVPAPGPNQPTETSLTPQTVRVVAGKTVSFDARASDPDAKIACHWMLFGDEQTALIPAIAMQRQSGRWNTPAKQAGAFSTTYTHTYEKPGIYRVQFGARSGDGCSSDYNPYGGESVSTATVTVTAQ